MPSKRKSSSGKSGGSRRSGSKKHGGSRRGGSKRGSPSKSSAAYSSKSSAPSSSGKSNTSAASSHSDLFKSGASAISSSMKSSSSAASSGSTRAHRGDGDGDRENPQFDGPEVTEYSSNTKLVEVPPSTSAKSSNKKLKKAPKAGSKRKDKDKDGGGSSKASSKGSSSKRAIPAGSDRASMLSSSTVVLAFHEGEDGVATAKERLKDKSVKKKEPKAPTRRQEAQEKLAKVAGMLYLAACWGLAAVTLAVMVILESSLGDTANALIPLAASMILAGLYAGCQPRYLAYRRHKREKRKVEEYNKALENAKPADKIRFDTTVDLKFISNAADRDSIMSTTSDEEEDAPVSAANPEAKARREGLGKEANKVVGLLPPSYASNPEINTKEWKDPLHSEPDLDSDGDEKKAKSPTPVNMQVHVLRTK